MIKLIGINKTFSVKKEKIEALKNINLEINEGDIFGIVGFSGAGKSTLVRIINYLEKPTSGKVIVNDNDLSKLTTKELRGIRKKIGMIFQHFNLLSSKNVHDNIAIPLKLNNTSKEEIDKKIKELLEFVGLAHKEFSFLKELSGGEKQRIGIARALATNPTILLCDEATSALDPQTTDSILKLLKKVNKEYKVTIVLITHEMNVIREICNKVVVMKNGEIVEAGNVLDVFGNPKSDTAKKFVKTVIKDDIPIALVKGVKDEKDSVIYKLKFIESNSKEAIISAINKNFNVQTNILFANVTEIQEKILGVLILQLKGTKDEREKSYKYLLEKQINVEEVFFDDIN